MLTNTHRRCEDLETYAPEALSRDERNDFEFVLAHWKAIQQFLEKPEAQLYGWTWEKAKLVLESILDYEIEHPVTFLERIKFSFYEFDYDYFETQVNMVQPYYHRPDRSEELVHFESVERGMSEINPFMGFDTNDERPCDDGRTWLTQEERCESCKESTYRACHRNLDTHVCGKKHKTEQSKKMCSGIHHFGQPHYQDREFPFTVIDFGRYWPLPAQNTFKTNFRINYENQKIYHPSLLKYHPKKYLCPSSVPDEE